MRKATLLLTTVFGCLLVSCVSETDESEPFGTVTDLSGDAFVSETINQGDASRAPFVGELDRHDAGNDSEHDAAEESPDAAEESPDAAEAFEESPDAAEESPDAAEESPDAAEESPDAAEESPDAAEESPDAAEGEPDAGDCNPLGTWRVYINPQFICFRFDRPEGFFIDVVSASCTQDVEVELDITDPNALYGHFVGTIVYHVSFVGDSMTATADIDGTVTTTAGSMVCDTTAFVTGVKQ